MRNKPANTLRRLLAIPLVLVLLIGVAWAYWSATTTAGSNGAAAAAALNAGGTPTALVSGADVTVSWPATTLTSGQAVTGYQIKRYNASNESQTMLSDCAVTITALTCTESNVPSGTWTYTVTPRFSTNWAGVESVKSNAIAVEAIDTTAPVNAIAVSGVTGGASKTGDTVYYRGSASGSFQLSNGVTDAASGPASSSTAALGGTTAGWSHTPSTVSAPASGPYVSNTFNWLAATTSSPTQVVTGRDVAGNTAATTLTFTNDTTAPVAGAIAYSDGVQPGASVSISLADSTDGGSGVATRRLQRSYAALTAGTCGAFTYFQDLGAVNPTSPYVDTAVSAGVCYRYRHVVTDGVGNQDIAANASVAMIASYDDTVTGTAGLLSQWRLGEPTTGMLSVDSFTAGGVGALLTTRLGETAATWTTAVGTSGTTAVTAAQTYMRGQAIRRGDAAGSAVYHTNAAPGSANYRVEADVIVRSLMANDAAGVVGRLNTVTGGSYLARYSSTSGAWELRSVSDGTTSVVLGTSFPQTLVANQIYHLALDLDGATIRLMVDGVTRVSATNADHTAAGRGGVRFDGTSVSTATTGLHLDNFEIKPAGYPRATDSFGANTGDYYSGPTLGAAGAITGSSNTAAQFDGIADYVRVDAPVGLPVGASARSVELWFKTTNTGQQALYSYGSDNAVHGRMFGLFLNYAGAGNVFTWGIGLDHDRTFTGAAAVNNGAWHHVVTTYNGTAMTVYVDGVSWGTQTTARNTVMNMYGFSLGGVLTPNDNNSGKWFNGSIDEVSFYSSVLSAADVSRRYAVATATTPAPDMVGPTGGSVTATGLGGAGNAYSTSTTLSLTLVKGTDPSGLAATGARLMRATATYTGTGGGNGTCGTFGSYTQVGADDPTSPRSDTVADTACYRYQYVVADSNGNETTYTSSDIRVDTTPYGAYWAFNEGTAATAEDSTGNGNTATLQAGAGWTGGKVGSNALSLTGAANSFASTPNPVIDTSESYTVAGWMNFTTLTGQHTLAAIDGTNISPFYLKRDGGNGRFQLSQTSNDSTTPTSWAVVNGLTPVIGTWYHLAGVYNKQAGTVQLFVNGVSQGSAPATPGWKAQGSTVVGQSRWAGASSAFTNGAIDEVRFYASALSGSQIATLADGAGPTGGSVTATGLVGTGLRYTAATTINLSLVQGTDPSGVATSGNTLRRATGTLVNGTCGTYGTYALVSTDPGATFAEAVTAGACYAYRYIVSDSLGNSTTYETSDIKVDSSAPSTPSRAFSAFTNTSASGTIVYYRSSAVSGSFTVTASATDPESGIASYAFPGLGTNWTSTAGSLGVNTYTWSGTPAAPGTKNITATNNATGKSANAPFTLTADTTAPSAGSVTYTDTTQTTTAISVAFTTGTDSGSGIGTRQLMRASASLSGTTCGTFGSFATITGGTDPGSSPVVDTVTGGSCYRYQYVVTDRVGNSHTATSASIVRVSVAATCASAQLIANPGFESGNNGAWTPSDGGMIVPDQAPANTGTWKVWLGGYGSANSDTVTQQVTIPAGCTASLSYYLMVNTAESSGPSDYIRVQVTANGSTTTVQTYSDRDFGHTYAQRFVDLSAYAGQTITLRFISAENASIPTSFFVDDVSLLTSNGTAGTYAQAISSTIGLLNWFRLGDTGSTDTFTGGTGATLQSRTGETAATWTKHSGFDGVITAGARLRKEGINTNASNYYTSLRPMSQDYTVKADVFVASAISNDVIGVVGRVNPANGTYYLARYEASNSSWTLFSVVNDNWTWLGGYYQPLTAGASYNLSLDMDGSMIRLLVDGVERLSVVNTAISAAGRGGIALGGSGSGTTITDTTGMHLDNFVVIPDATDSKGTNHGEIVSGVTLGIAGATTGDSNTAMSFDGVDDHISVTRQIQDDLSIEFWFRSTQGTGAGTQWWSGAGMVDAEVYGAGNDFGVSLFANGSVVAGVGAPDVSIVSPTGYNNGAWHHVVFTRAAGTGTLHLYVDGALAGTVTGTTPSALTGPPTIHFGRQQAGGNYYAGALDEVALYNAVLTQAQVTAHYNAR